jgi:hypothetical protein
MIANIAVSVYLVRMIRLLICCSLFLVCCTAKDPTLIGTWKAAYLQDNKISPEENEMYRRLFASGESSDELSFQADSLVIHRYRKGKEKWSEFPKSNYALSADRKKLTTTGTLGTNVYTILLLTSDSLKLQFADGQVNVYSRKNN